MIAKHVEEESSRDNSDDEFSEIPTETLQKIKEQYAALVDDLKRSEKTIRNLIENLTRGTYSKPPSVVSRVKTRESCIKKVERKYLSKIENDGEVYIKSLITDLIGIRVICLYEHEVEPVANDLIRSLSLIERTDKNTGAEISQDRFGYKGIHLDCKIPNDRRDLAEYVAAADLQFEVQVRSVVQDAWSQIDHHIKYKSALDPNTSRRVVRLSALFELADQEFSSIYKETKGKTETSNQATDADIEKPRAKTAKKESQTAAAEITIHQLSSVFEEHFPRYHFYDDQVTKFFFDLKQVGALPTIIEFIDSYKLAEEKAKSFRAYLFQKKNLSINPLTQIRHALFFSNEEKYGYLLNERQKATAVEFLEGKRE
jgi:putative GTP pyrophosphokinase